MLTLIQRHITRQKILNWKQSLRFPSRPRVSHEGVNLMQQLLCEPEDRLGSQTSSSVSRPNSVVMQARRSQFIQPGISPDNDGAHLIKVWIPATVALWGSVDTPTERRPTPGSRASIGKVFTDTLHPTDRTLSVLKIHVISTQTFHQR
jgi:hypothetical protein